MGFLGAANAERVAHHDRPAIPGARNPEALCVSAANRGRARTHLVARGAGCNRSGRRRVDRPGPVYPACGVRAGGDMAAAYFISHAPVSFFPILNRGDAAILFCFVFLYLAAAGGGVWS